METNEILSPEEMIPNEEAVLPTEEPIAPPPPEEDLAALREEINTLRAALAQKEMEQKRAMEEMGEFSRLFPTASLREIPDAVWQDVEQGVPLSAAYALYEKRNRIDALHAEEINRRNAERSAGAAGTNTPSEYFSPEEVRSMSASEVRNNYKRIRESMKKWR